MLVEGVGPKKAQDLLAAIVKADNPYRALREVSGKSGKGLKDLALTLESLSGSDGLQPAEQVNHAYEYYLPILKTQYDDYPKRIRDLDHLHTIAEGYPDLDQLLADLALEPPDGSAIDVGAPDRDDERLVLSTIHSAKGLEWQCVFVIWIVGGRFPSVYSFVTDEDLEEERRLFYVAVTRAKRHLLLTHPINASTRAAACCFRSRLDFWTMCPPRCSRRWRWSKRGGARTGILTTIGTCNPLLAHTSFTVID
jgi:DNA helicase-2/ATP-dependent DNA helicase PcrA